MAWQSFFWPVRRAQRQRAMAYGGRRGCTRDDVRVKRAMDRPQKRDDARGVGRHAVDGRRVRGIGAHGVRTYRPPRGMRVSTRGDTSVTRSDSAVGVGEVA